MQKVFMIGNLVRDPELTETSSGVMICRFTIAVNRNYGGVDTPRKTDFFDCKAWRGVAETISRYAKKGNKIAIVGTIEQREYQNKKGENCKVYELQISDFEFLPSNHSSDTAVQENNSNDNKSRMADMLKGLQEIDDDGDIPF
jgi:single-strand DNA-binding protein